MFERVKGLRWEGIYFKEECIMNFFENNNRVSIVYGRNGSGKSSLEKAFREYKTERKEFTKIDLISHDNHRKCR